MALRHDRMLTGIQDRRRADVAKSGKRSRDIDDIAERARREVVASVETRRVAREWDEAEKLPLPLSLEE